MSEQPATPWSESNRRYLMTALGDVRRALETSANPGADLPAVSSAQTLAEIAEGMSPPPALETLVRVFELSPFERNVLLLCAGIELDGTFGGLCAAGNASSARLKVG